MNTKTNVRKRIHNIKFVFTSVLFMKTATNVSAQIMAMVFLKAEYSFVDRGFE